MLARPTDLARDPLDRHLLFRAGPERYFWLHAPHHIVVDGVTGAMMIRRVAEAYTSLVDGTPLAPATDAPLRQIVTEDRDTAARSGRAGPGLLAGADDDLPETVSFGGRTGVTPSGRVSAAAPTSGRSTRRRCGPSPRRARTSWTVVVLAAAAALICTASAERRTWSSACR